MLCNRAEQSSHWHTTVFVSYLKQHRRTEHIQVQAYLREQRRGEEEVTVGPRQQCATPATPSGYPCRESRCHRPTALSLSLSF
jgi:hypothetical protein